MTMPRTKMRVVRVRRTIKKKQHAYTPLTHVHFEEPLHWMHVHPLAAWALILSALIVSAIPSVLYAQLSSLEPVGAVYTYPSYGTPIDGAYFFTQPATTTDPKRCLLQECALLFRGCQEKFTEDQKGREECLIPAHECEKKCLSIFSPPQVNPNVLQ